jgi:hypothetical protein
MPPPFSQTTNPRRHSSPLILNSGHLMLLVITIFFVFIIPSFLSFDSQIFRPLLVAKKNCHSLSLVLVFFVIVCAFLSTDNNNNKIENTSSYHNQHPSISYPSTPQYQRSTQYHYTNVSNSLPHLHQSYLPQSFHIGTQVRNNWDPSSDHPQQRQDWIQEEFHFQPNNVPQGTFGAPTSLPTPQSPHLQQPNLRQSFHNGTQVRNNRVLSSNHPKRRRDWIQEERDESHFQPNNVPSGTFGAPEPSS